MDYLFILIILVTVLLCARFNNYSNYVIICFVVILQFLYSKTYTAEHLTDAEAVANVAKLYDAGNFQVTNLKVTGNLEVAGKVTSNLDVTGNVTASGNINNTGNITTGGNVTATGNGTFGNAFIGKHDNGWARFGNKDFTGGTGGFYSGAGGHSHAHGVEFIAHVNGVPRLSVFSNKIRSGAPIFGGDMVIDMPMNGEWNRDVVINKVVQTGIFNGAADGESASFTPRIKYDNGDRMHAGKIWCIKQPAKDGTSKVLCNWYGEGHERVPLYDWKDKWDNTWLQG